MSCFFPASPPSAAAFFLSFLALRPLPAATNGRTCVAGTRMDLTGAWESQLALPGRGGGCWGQRRVRPIGADLLLRLWGAYT